MSCTFIHINGVTLVMYWTRLLWVCKVGWLHATHDILLGLKSSVGQLPWPHVSAADTSLQQHTSRLSLECSDRWSERISFCTHFQIADLKVSIFVQNSQIGDLNLLLCFF